MEAPLFPTYISHHEHPSTNRNIPEDPMKNLETKFHRAMLTLALMAPIVAVSQVPAPVNLRSTANFAVLAGSLVSDIPTSAVTGDVGLSPAAGSNITGFGGTEVTGTIYTVDASGPAGSVPAATRLTTAKGDLTTAFNDAAGRTPIPTGPFLNPGSGNMGGLTLVAGLYKFTSDALITGSDLTLTGSATDVWIFQIASALNVGNGIHVVLAGGAQPSNIFWQVGTSATLGTTCIFKGTIMADQSISMNTGAVLDGRALARIAAVTLASNAITRPTTVSGTLTGTVRRSFDTSVHLNNALVILRRGSAAGTFVDSTRTNASGTYTFSGVPSGTPNYWIAVSASGFISTTTAGTVGLAITSGVTTRSNVSLVAPGTIICTMRYGTIGNYTPIANALIVLRQGTATSPILDSVRTNATGQCTLSVLTPGTNYRVTASANGYATTNVTPITVTDEGTTITNITAAATSLYPILSSSRGIHFSRIGGQLNLDLGFSVTPRSIQIFNLKGTLQGRVSVPASQSHAMIPARFSPENGFLFRIK